MYHKIGFRIVSFITSILFSPQNLYYQLQQLFTNRSLGCYMLFSLDPLQGQLYLVYLLGVLVQYHHIKVRTSQPRIIKYNKTFKGHCQVPFIQYFTRRSSQHLLQALKRTKGPLRSTWRHSNKWPNQKTKFKGSLYSTSLRNKIAGSLISQTYH